MSKNYYSIFIRFITLFFPIIFFFSCNPDPSRTLEEYLELTYLNNDPKGAYQLLSRDDQQYKSEEDYILDHKRKNLIYSRFLKNHKEHFSYEIAPEDYDIRDTVKLKVTLYKPSSQSILKEMLVFAMASSAGMEEEEKERLLEKHYEKVLQEEESEVEIEERVFTLIRENGSFRVFFDFGKPFRDEVLNKKLDKLSNEANEFTRRMDYENALLTYQEMLMLKKDNYILQKLKELEELTYSQISLGEKKQIGKVFIKPLRVEVKKISFERKNWLGGAPKAETSQESYFVLTILVSNQFEGEFFKLFEEGRHKQNHIVRDNYGNDMLEFKPDFDILSIEGNYEGKLQPGETRIIKVVCEPPLSTRSEKFIWNMRMVIDNKQTTTEVQVKFNRDEIIFENTLKTTE